MDLENTVSLKTKHSWIKLFEYSTWIDDAQSSVFPMFNIY